MPIVGVRRELAATMYVVQAALVVTDHALRYAFGASTNWDLLSMSFKEDLASSVMNIEEQERYESEKLPSHVPSTTAVLKLVVHSYPEWIEVEAHCELCCLSSLWENLVVTLKYQGQERRVTLKENHVYLKGHPEILSLYES